MAVYGIVLKPKCRLQQKRERLQKYFFTQSIWAKEDMVFQTLDEFDIEKYEAGDVLVFVDLEDLYFLQLSNALRAILSKHMTIHLIPYYDR